MGLEAVCLRSCLFWALERDAGLVGDWDSRRDCVRGLVGREVDFLGFDEVVVVTCDVDFIGETR
jgi:hypothetical protein